MSNQRSPNSAIRAVLWDFGGVFTTSPFTAFTRYEEAHGLPKDFIRTINATNPDGNAWALMERNDVTREEFGDLFEAESKAAGHAVNGRDILPLLSGELQPEMVTALSIVAKSYKTACLTNNMRTGHGPSMSGDPDKAARIAKVMDIFEHVVESSRAGVRKPEPRFYEIACEMLEIQPSEAVFLDDLGVNLKPARAMGMTTIKVVGPDQAIGDLEAILGIPLR
ncbi:MAG: HAD-IA family hydrolase [Rhodospirillaceae bacterium]|jgi:putative hydrolase of the HAD superfamily|nr:HAD-IA family hydrolase [Rhodospirillaceae bacterium]MBT5191781.1 HAD-IA family hydrolase [Rhodospirillaceae bacterium]MBT6431184.1 HAD-IA family hydrolase [Rhodospirillaceae bacterium]MBT6588330.1 HAD-IA family hydrolase [Rhodospirillaceae bacterium]MBT7756122.1 HAD-IA family hydrolase [Rhodospirillaceae bacterium]